MKHQRRITKKCLLTGLVSLLLLCALPQAAVEACPMCKTAVEDSGDTDQPRAYMLSILTMLTMPAILATVLGVTLYRISRYERQIVEEMTAENDLLTGHG